MRQGEKIKKAFREGKISIAKLFEMTSEQRVKVLTDLVGKENALFFVSKLERAYMLPRQNKQ